MTSRIELQPTSRPGRGASRPSVVVEANKATGTTTINGAELTPEDARRLGRFLLRDELQETVDVIESQMMLLEADQKNGDGPHNFAYGVARALKQYAKELRARL